MNKAILKKNYRSYHIPSMPNHHSVKRDAIFISTANSVKHELTKSFICILIKNFGDFRINQKIISLINEIDAEVETFGFPKSEGAFLTEACPNEERDRRVDVVNLGELEKKHQRIEIETNHRTQKFPNGEGTTIYI